MLRSDHSASRGFIPGGIIQTNCGASEYHDAASDKNFVFLTNNFTLPALTIAELYRCRWQVELFFKWIKQHLRIKAFYGTTENAVKTQIWTAVSVYVLVAIIKKRLNLKASLYTILQIFERDHFRKKPLITITYRFRWPGTKPEFS